MNYLVKVRYGHHCAPLVINYRFFCCRYEAEYWPIVFHAISVKPHLRDGRTDRRREYKRRELYSRRLSVRLFVTSRSDVDTA